MDEAAVESSIGRMKSTNQVIIAKLTYPYKADILRERVEICTNDLNSELSPKLTLLYGDNNFDEIYPHTIKEEWKEFHFAMQETLKDIYTNVCILLIQNNITISKQINLGIYQDKYLVYCNNKLSHIFDPEYDDFDRSDTIPLTSRFAGVKTARVSEEYKNVIYSTGDKYPNTVLKDMDGNSHTLRAGTSWIAFWSFCTDEVGRNRENRPICCYYNQLSQTGNGHICNAKKNNSGNIFGCHSVDKIVECVHIPHSASVPDSRPIVYIIPACSNSNHTSNKNSFAIQRQTSIVVLWDYYKWEES